MDRAKKMKRTIIGIDEVGRGALAGPVVVAAVALACRPSQIVSAAARHSLGLTVLKDSKKLSARQRELWYSHFLKHPKISFAVARVYPREIEKRNISQAANLAARRAFKRLGTQKSAAKIFLDGGLYLTNRRWQGMNVAAAKTIVKADEKVAAVAVASIIAKVHRDRFMCRLAKQYPAYGFEVHKGYGTRRHQLALKRAGPCVAHRQNFLKAGRPSPVPMFI